MMLDAKLCWELVMMLLMCCNAEKLVLMTAMMLVDWDDMRMIGCDAMLRIEPF